MATKVVKVATKAWVESQNFIKPSDTVDKETLLDLVDRVETLESNYGTALSTTEEILNG